MRLEQTRSVGTRSRRVSGRMSNKCTIIIFLNRVTVSHSDKKQPLHWLRYDDNDDIKHAAIITLSMLSEALAFISMLQFLSPVYSCG